MRRFGVAAGRVRSSAFRFGDSARRVGLRIHCFRFSARAVSEIALGELVLPLSGLPFGLIASAFRHAPLRSGRSAGWSSGSLLPLFGTHRFGVAAGRVRSSAFRFGNCPQRVGLRTHRFHFSVCAASEIALGGLAFGLTASAFRHAALRRFPSAGWRFRSASWPSGSPLPLFGMHRFGVAAGRLAFGLPLPLFGIRRSAPPCRRREGRRSTPTRHLFHFKTLISTC